MRDEGETTQWSWGDILAFTGHVISVNGQFDWIVFRKNCSVCNWVVIGLATVPNGRAAAFVHNNVHNDHVIFSKVTAMDDNSSHHHDTAWCHDFYGRNAGSFFAGGCRITLNGTDTYCAPNDNYNQEPSIIITGPFWGGDGNQLSCP